MKGERTRRRRVGLLGALTAVSGFVMWGGNSAYAIQGGFLGDEEGTVQSGPLDMRDVSPNTTLTECPQAGLTGNGAQPLNSHRQDTAEQKSAGSDKRLNQDFSCMPQDETAVDQNPKVQTNYVAGANDYRLGWGTSGFYSTTDKGAHWYDGITPFPSLPSGQNLDGGGDPAVVFDRGGVAYYAQINFNRTDDTSGVWVNRSTNGGFTWTRPCVAIGPIGAPADEHGVCGGPGDPRQPGDGTVSFIQDNDKTLNGSVPAHDKEWITAGPRPTGQQPTCFTPFTHTATACNPAVVGTDRIYVTFSLFAAAGTGAGNAQIFLSYSDDQARSWSSPKPIYGSGSFCVGTPGQTCRNSQGSQPTVNPTTGQLWVGFQNGDTQDEDQYLVVTSRDGGNTFSLPSRVDTLYDVNFPRGVNGRTDCINRGQGATRAVPTNSCFRYDPIFNSIVADKRGGEFANSVYVVLGDNRNGTIRNSNEDIFFYKSTDGGVTWIGPTRVNNDPSQAPLNRDCGRNVDSIRGNPAGCPAQGTGNDQFFPFVTISTDGVLNVTFHDRRLDTSSPVGSGAWPASKTEVGNYLVWYWGAQCKITHAQTVSQLTTGAVPAGASQCVAPEAVVNPTVATGFDPGAGPVPGQNQNSATLPFRNFQISDVGSNFDYSFRAGIFAGDYSGNVSGPTVAAGSSTGNRDSAENGDRGARDAIAVWTDARNGRGSGAPTSFQPGRNPICEQSDVFFKFFNNQNAGSGSKGNEGDSANGFLVAPCGSDLQDRAGAQGGDNSQNH